jgi:hypothetical protein
LRTAIIGSQESPGKEGGQCTEEKEKDDMERGDRNRSACDKLAKLKNECIIMLRMKVLLKYTSIIILPFIIARINVLLM